MNKRNKRNLLQINLSARFSTEYFLQNLYGVDAPNADNWPLKLSKAVTDGSTYTRIWYV